MVLEELHLRMWLCSSGLLGLEKLHFDFLWKSDGLVMDAIVMEGTSQNVE